MSGKAFAPGDVICANGQEKLSPELEDPLEAHRPTSAAARRNFFYCRPNTDFHRCGIVDPKYIYRVEPTGEREQPQVHDLAWIGDMQLALLKQKHGAAHAAYIARYPDWSDDLVRRCCEGYWVGETGDPVWEYLFP
jgi:hypothetical protein